MTEPFSRIRVANGSIII